MPRAPALVLFFQNPLFKREDEAIDICCIVDDLPVIMTDSATPQTATFFIAYSPV